MGRWSLIVLLVIVAASAVWLRTHLRSVQLKQERAVFYQQTLRSYTAVLSQGATRKQVEDELRSRGKSYQRVSGFEPANAFADLVKIGTEPAPWYCGKNGIYVKFAFDAADPRLDQTSQLDSDILRSIAVTPWLQDCL